MNTNDKLTSGEVFNAAYDSIDTVIPFDMKWNNGTGYFDSATKLDVVNGTFAKSADESGRKIIFIGTILGTFVVFERYSNNKEVIVMNAPCHEVYMLNMAAVQAGRLSADSLTALFDTSYFKLARRLDDAYAMFNRVTVAQAA